MLKEDIIKNIKLEPLIDTLQLLKISDEEYFSSKYENHISNSKMGLINPDQDGSPEKFESGFSHGFNISFLLGSAVHMMTLQPEYFELCETVDMPGYKSGEIAERLYNKDGILPTNDQILTAAKEVDFYGGNLGPKLFSDLKEKVNKYITERSNAEKEYQGNKELFFLDAASKARYYSCMECINNDNNFKQLLKPIGLFEPIQAENEWAILLDLKVTVAEHEPFVIHLKAKLDNFTIDKYNNKIVINDLKTHGRLMEQFPDALNNFHYYRELSYYSMLLSLVCEKYYGMNNPTIEGNFLVVTTRYPFETRVFRMTKDLYMKGIEEYKYLLKLICYHSIYGFYTEA